jgi:nucleoside 2-deoxyribosyltransferase
VSNSALLPTPPRAYLAGPEVFLPRAKVVGAKKKAICEAHGLEGVFPLDEEPSAASSDPADVARSIFQVCVDLMNSCDLIIANLTPFRGVSMDVGTAVEIGYMFAFGKPVFEYTNVRDSYSERVKEAKLAGLDEIVEDFGLSDNLMCVIPAELSGAPAALGMVTSDRLFTDLKAFEECTARAALAFKARMEQ